MPAAHTSTLKPEKCSEPEATSGGWKAGEPRLFEHLQPYVKEAATACERGCNRRQSRGCSRMRKRLRLHANAAAAVWRKRLRAVRGGWRGARVGAAVLVEHVRDAEVGDLVHSMVHYIVCMV